MKTEWSLLFLIFCLGMLAGTIVYMATADIREQTSNRDTKEALQKISYFKDQNGNCYAYQPNTPKFSWIPCELTK
jgi:dipeptide/tripeptide permease